MDTTAVRTRLGADRAWHEHGARVRSALQRSLSTPEQWQPEAGAARCDVLRLAAQQVIDGKVGDYIRSHGGHVELLSAKDDEVEVRLSGACSHCPAADLTLSNRLEVGIRASYPELRRLTARSGAGLGGGRRLLGLLPSRHG